MVLANILIKYKYCSSVHQPHLELGPYVLCNQDVHCPLEETCEWYVYRRHEPEPKPCCEQPQTVGVEIQTQIYISQLTALPYV